MTPYERYHQDAQFRQLVDLLEYQVRELRLTPTEVREAAVLACIHYEQRTFRPHIIPVRLQDCIEPRRRAPWEW